MPDGESPAAWEAALSRQTWEGLRVVLAQGREATPRASNTSRWLLTGIARCGPCGSGLQIRYQGHGRPPMYGCVQPGCRRVFRSVEQLDSYIGGQVVNFLNNPLAAEGRELPADHAAEWAVLEREHAATLGKLRDFRTSAGTLDALAARLESIDGRMAELRDLAAGTSRARLLGRYRGITRKRWENELTLAERRTLAAACFTVTVLPSSRRGPGFNTDDVRVEPVT